MQVVAERCQAQLLSGPPARSPVDVAQRLLAVQAQHPRGARLAVRARTRGLVATDVDRALTVDRSLVVTWLNRGTLHLVGHRPRPVPLGRHHAGRRPARTGRVARGDRSR